MAFIFQHDEIVTHAGLFDLGTDGVLLHRQPPGVTSLGDFFQSQHQVENLARQLFVAIQNIQLGYTFQNIFPQSGNKSSLRVSFTAERPFNFFSYNGFTTDVADGIDNDVYPLTSTYSIGFRLVY